MSSGHASMKVSTARMARASMSSSPKSGTHAGRSIGLTIRPTAAYPPEKRGGALGIFAALTGLAVVSGPVLGGAITQGLEWRWIFWINVPLAAIVIPLVLARVEENY